MLKNLAIALVIYLTGLAFLPKHWRRLPAVILWYFWSRKRRISVSVEFCIEKPPESHESRVLSNDLKEMST